MFYISEYMHNASALILSLLWLASRYLILAAHNQRHNRDEGL